LIKAKNKKILKKRILPNNIFIKNEDIKNKEKRKNEEIKNEEIRNEIHQEIKQFNNIIEIKINKIYDSIDDDFNIENNDKNNKNDIFDFNILNNEKKNREDKLFESNNFDKNFHENNYLNFGNNQINEVNFFWINSKIFTPEIIELNLNLDLRFENFEKLFFKSLNLELNIKDQKVFFIFKKKR
jgi:hypothetical protein